MSKLKLLIRGHVRNSFDDGRLKDLISLFAGKYDLEIFVHSWNKIQNGLSWRHLDPIDAEVDEGFIKSYFGEFSSMIREVIIDDDSKIQIHGNTEGTIGRTPCPILAWKNMYYGKLKLVERVCEAAGENEVAVQTRFDLMSHQFSPTMEKVSDFLDENYDSISKGDKEERIRFIEMRPCFGVDNLYMSSVGDMRKFIRYMYLDMDRILEVHRGTYFQEHISFHERKSPFHGD